MWETALAFAISGSYGRVLTIARIDPVLTAIARSAGVGIILTGASVAILRLLGAREITAPIPWRSGFRWIAGSVMLVDEVFYSVSAVNGPVAVIGLASVCSAKVQQAGLGTLVATLFSLFLLRDAPATSTLVAGARLVIGAIAVSARSDE